MTRCERGDAFIMANEQPPLSHHDILRASAPFVQRGLGANLAASDRAARRITFVPKTQDDEALALTYDLYLLPPDPPVLIRRAVLDGSLQATTNAQGMDVAGLIDAVQALAPERQFRRVGGALIADSYDVTNSGAPRLTACTSSIGPLLIEMDARTVVGEAMTTRLYVPDPNARLALPDDLFALVDRRWRPLFDHDDGWSTSLRPPVREPQRSDAARDIFGATMDHVARVLSEAPGAYHQTYGRRRWWVFWRRYVPIGACVAIVGALPLIDRFLIGDDTTLHPGFISLPPMLMIVVMLLSWRDMPLFEIPPRPRRLPDHAWPASPAPHTDFKPDGELS